MSNSTNDWFLIDWLLQNYCFQHGICVCVYLKLIPSNNIHINFNFACHEFKITEYSIDWLYNRSGWYLTWANVATVIPQQSPIPVRSKALGVVRLRMLPQPMMISKHVPISSAIRALCQTYKKYYMNVYWLFMCQAISTLDTQLVITL